MAATIDIQTPHNVTIAFRLAPLSNRIFAFLADQFILLLVIILFYLFIEMLLPEMLQDELGEFISSAIMLTLYFGYSLLLETFWQGQTIGKRLMGLRVRKEDGSMPTLFDYLVRWVFRIPDLALSAGMLAVLMVGSSKKSQRLGDMMAGTILVQEPRSVLGSVAQLQRIKSKDDYQPRYPAVIRLSEDDVLVLKELINRSTKFGGIVYQDLAKKTAQRMEQLLMVTRQETNAIEFLKVLVREYVILTR